MANIFRGWPRGLSPMVFIIKLYFFPFLISHFLSSLYCQLSTKGKNKSDMWVIHWRHSLQYLNPSGLYV